VCSSTGECVADAGDESSCPLPDASCFIVCPDGLCLTGSSINAYNSVCGAHKCTLRCNDRTCGLLSSTAPLANISSTTPGNLCVLSGTQNARSTSALINRCPAWLPYRCPDNGLCALSSARCIATASSTTACPSERPVSCADSSCVLDASQCPAIYPCSASEMRCGDGSCRVRQPSDTGNECTAWGIANTCPLLLANDASKGRRYRCSTGTHT